MLPVEQPNGDFAVTIARQFVVSYYQYELYRRLTESTDATLAAIAAKAVKEVDYHRDHSAQWVLRLGLRHRRIAPPDDPRLQVRSGRTWTSCSSDDELTDRLATASPSALRACAQDFDASPATVLAEAELEVPDGPARPGGGRRGKHSEHLGYILAEMQVLAREHPGASW